MCKAAYRPTAPRRLRLLATCCLAVFGAPAASASELTRGAWTAAVEKQHALAGRIYEPSSGSLRRFSDQDGALWSGAGILLLGEVHDNPDHHRVQAWIIEQFVAAAAGRRPPGIVFEHIRTDQQAALDQFNALREAGRPATSGDLFRLLEWDKSGWPPQAIFAPLIDVVIKAGLAIYPASPPRQRVRAVGRGDKAEIGDAERTRLQLDASMHQGLLDALTADLKDSHCGLLPEPSLAPMAVAQRYRDAAFADAILEAAAKHGAAILVAGNGHVRGDRGVPWYLRRRAPDKALVTLMLVEVEPDRSEPGAYIPRDPGGKSATDFILFTPRVERADPCEAMRLQRKG